MPEAVIVAATRSPIGKAGSGSLSSARADDLATQSVRAALDQVPELDPAEIEDLLLGCGLPGGEQGFNMARRVSVLLGHDRMPGATVTRYCASSLQTTRMAFHAIRAGEGTAYISAGVESVSSLVRGSSDAPSSTRHPAFAEARRRTKAQATSGEPWRDPRAAGELPDIHIGMGHTAENLAEQYGITREEMDQFSLRSQTRTARAAREGFWASDISPVVLSDGRIVDGDDSPRPNSTYEGLAALAPAFRPQGTVTAGNSCPLNDGAAALVVMSEQRAHALGIRPLARIISTAISGLSPEIMGLGPVEATRIALGRAGMSIDDIDRVEINEAFAAQVIACQRELRIDDDRLNVRGGAIALGHPFGMTGARITTTLIHSLQADDGSIGLETMCVAGGQGMAMIIERLT